LHYILCGRLRGLAPFRSLRRPPRNRNFYREPEERQMTERLVNVVYRFANSIALLLLFAAATIGWAEFLWQAGSYPLTIIFAAAAFAAWLAGRIFLFLSTGR
jgi:hypothetical protein